MDDQPRRTQRTPRPETQAILDDIRAGMSYPEAAAKYGKSYAAIANTGKIYGLGREYRSPGSRRKIPKPPPPERGPAILPLSPAPSGED